MEQMKILGLRAKDRVTGFVGVVTTVSFDLYGCVQAVVSPEVAPEKPGELADARWFDVHRLTTFPGEPVMPVPSFAFEKGPAMKPPMPSLPIR